MEINSYEKILDFVTSPNFDLEELIGVDQEIIDIKQKVLELEKKFGVSDEVVNGILEEKIQRMDRAQETVDKIMVLENLRDKLSGILSEIEKLDFKELLSTMSESADFNTNVDEQSSVIISLINKKVLVQNDLFFMHLAKIILGDDDFKKYCDLLHSMIMDLEDNLEEVDDIYAKLGVQNSTVLRQAVLDKIDELDRQIDFLHLFEQARKIRIKMMSHLHNFNAFDDEFICLFIEKIGLDKDEGEENENLETSLQDDELDDKEVINTMEEPKEEEAETIDVDVPEGGEEDANFMSDLLPENLDIETESDLLEREGIKRFNVVDFPEIGTIEQMREKGQNIPEEIKLKMTELAEAVPMLTYDTLTPAEIEKLALTLAEAKEMEPAELANRVGNLSLFVSMAANPKKGRDYSWMEELPKFFMNKAERLELENNTPREDTVNKVALGILLVHKKFIKHNIPMDGYGKISELWSNVVHYSKEEDFAKSIKELEITPLTIILLDKTREFFEDRVEVYRQNVIKKGSDLLESHVELFLKLRLKEKSLKDFLSEDVYKGLIVGDWQGSIISRMKGSILSYLSNGLISSPQMQLLIRDINDYVAIIQDLIDANPEFSEIVATDLERPNKNVDLAHLEIIQRLSDKTKTKITHAIASGKGKHHLLYPRFNNFFLDLYGDKEKGQLCLNRFDALMTVADIAKPVIQDYFDRSLEERETLKKKYALKDCMYWQFFFGILDSYIQDE